MPSCPRCFGLVQVEEVILPEAFPIREDILHCLICGHEDAPTWEINRREHEMTKDKRISSPLLIRGKNGRKRKG